MVDRLSIRAREAYEEHRDFCLLALLFTSFRFLTLLLFEPGGYILDWSGYYIPGANFVELSDWGYYPIVDYWMEYPPLFPWLSVLVYRLSLLLPAWRDPELWYNLLLGSTFLLFEIGNFLLVYAIALKLRGRQAAVRNAWLYAGLFFPLMTLLFWFENFAVFFLLLGVYMIIARRPVWGGLAAGLGFLVKLVPAFIAPVALRTLPGLSRKATYVLVAALVVLLVSIPFLLTNATFFLTPYLYQGSTGPWETIWALLDGYYSGGETTPFEMRFDPNNIVVAFHESNFPYWLVVVAFVALYLFLYTRPIDWQDDLKAVAFCGLSINLFLLFSKGYSPQWIVNLLPFLVLLLPDLRGVAYSVLLMLANVAEFPIGMMLLQGHPWLYALAVLFRTALLVLVAIEFGLILFPSTRIKRAIGFALTSLVLLAIIGSLPVAALALRDYSAERYAESPYRQTIDFLSAQPAGGVICTDPGLYHHLYSFLVTSKGMYLLEANEHLPDALGRLVERHPRLYVLYAGSEDDELSNPAVEQWLNGHTFPLGAEWLENARVTAYATSTSPLEEQLLEPVFADEIELTTCALDPGPLAPTEVLRVSLSWRSLRSVDTDYTVFVHLIDEGESVWAQHDSHPVGGSRPTSSWQTGEEIIDHHGLTLPADIPPGEYNVALGLYDATSGERLLVITAEQGMPTGRVVVGPVVVEQTSRRSEPWAD
jgi:hypothetical protein